ncbi:MAG: acyl-CoA dehydrogenase family protein, partial [Candidatus Puniceispirillaceae bacterium]
MEGVVSTTKPVFSWEDPFQLDQQLNDEERMVRDTARQFARDVLLPRVITDFREESFDPDVMRQMGELGLLGPTIPHEYGGAGVNHVSYGLAAYEIEAIDSGYRSAMSVQSSLVMHPIHQFGTEDQKQRFLPRLATAELIGCFGLTEPDYGSDPGGMVTKAVKVDGGYHLSGAKMWISNAPIADIAVVWAKLDGKIRGFIIERDTAGAGFSTPKIEGKLSLRASITGSLQMDNAFVPDANIFPEVAGLKGPFSCLNKARYGIAWGTLGAAQFCYDAARTYTLDRKQFGRPLAANQLVQLKLADMHTEISIGLQACLRVGRLLDEGNCPPENISTIKRNSCGKALDIARAARD